jgi:hypothetical protein
MPVIDSASLPVLSGWESFYVIVGSSGAALTGLMFVVIAIVADSPQIRSASAIEAFGTPTMVHFCIALLVSAVTSAPWHRIWSLAAAIAAIGLGGVTYGCIVIARAIRQTNYKPVFQDWLWYMALPLVAHITFVVAGLLLPRLADTALFFIAAATLLLLLIGIHNAWDTVTYIAIDMRNASPPEAATPPAAKPPPPPAGSPPSAARR